MFAPEPLKKGDLVGITAPARNVYPVEIEEFHRVMEDWGLRVIESPALFKSHHRFAGDDETRRDAFQRLLDQEKVRAIFCARGGYGTNRILDKLDFTKFREHPKWIIGYSDITLIHAYLQNVPGIESLHAIMPFTFGKKEKGREASLESLRKALFGEPLSYVFPEVKIGRPGKGQGVLQGGNLSVLYSLLATPGVWNPQGSVLFIEDIDEYLYHIDRMLIAMDVSGKLDRLEALFVGYMTGMRDWDQPFGYGVREIVDRVMEPHKYPYVYDFPAGHEEPNHCLILGRALHYEIGDSGMELKFIQPHG